MRIKKEQFSRDSGFIVLSLTILFYFLERISVFFWIRELFGAGKTDEDKNESFVDTPMFSEIWVLGNITLAILAKLILPYIHYRWLAYFFMIYAIERIFEMFVYQVNVLFFERLRPIVIEEKPRRRKKKSEETYKIVSPIRTVILLMFNMMEYVLQFLIVYVVINVLQGSEFTIGVIQSFQIFMSMEDLKMIDNTGILAFAYMETLLGVFMNVACIAYFIGMLPVTESKLQQK